MIHETIAYWLFAFGGITALLAAQFLLPAWYSRTFNKIDVEPGPTNFYARQAGLAIAVQGALLVWASFDPALRLASVVLVGFGKALFVGTIVLHLRKYPGLLVSAVIDALAVLVFAGYLLGW